MPEIKAIKSKPAVNAFDFNSANLEAFLGLGEHNQD